jgi:predicted TPR repeat methyltransferase
MEYDRPEDDGDIMRLRERLFLDPHDVDAMRALAEALERLGDLPGAVDLQQRALRVDPYRTDSMLDLGRLWRQLANRERATSWYARALAIDPDCEHAASELVAMAAEGGLPDAYIRTLFDQYADRFDAELTGTLNYRAPALVAAMLEDLGVPEASAEILDLGCGTGLSGVALKRFAAALDGVDLSSRMVAEARRKGFYRTLHVGEARAFLGGAAASWDIVAAVDVLNYVGDLTPLFTAARARLPPGGLMVGTVEKSADGSTRLTAKQRYVHSREALSVALSDSGLSAAEVTDGTLRTEAGAPVAGLIFAARR